MLSKSMQLALLLTVPKIRTRVEPYLKEEYFVDENAKKVFRWIRDKRENISTSVLRTALSGELDQRVLDEAVAFLESLPRTFNETELAVLVEKYEDFIRGYCLKQAVEAAVEGSMKKATQILKSASSLSLSKIEYKDFLSLEASTFLSKGERSVLKSKYSVVNEAFAFGGYTRKQVVMIAAAPGVGKSTLAINEAECFLRQGYKVLHYFLGDITEDDVRVRYTACHTGSTIRDVLANYEEVRKQQEQSPGIFENLRVAILPAGKFSSSEIVAEALSYREEFDYDCVIIDYDGNLRNLQVPSGVHMYVEGGQAYADFDYLAKTTDSLVMVLSQTARPYWGEEIVTKQAPNESSRKLQSVDAMIGLGRNPQCRMVGSVHLAKMRRGEEGVVFRVKFLLDRSTIMEISDEEYRMIKSQMGG